MKILLLSVLLGVSCIVSADELRPFTTDGCSLFPNGSLSDKAKWMNCCIQHDLAYWKGGTKSERQIADGKLRRCVDEVGEKRVSDLMHLGVRLGGSPAYPSWYRWGYGWPYTRGYKVLTPDEQTEVNRRLKELRNFIDEAIQQTK